MPLSSEKETKYLFGYSKEYPYHAVKVDAAFTVTSQNKTKYTDLVTLTEDQVNLSLEELSKLFPRTVSEKQEPEQEITEQQ